MGFLVIKVKQRGKEFECGRHVTGRVCRDEPAGGSLLQSGEWGGECMGWAGLGGRACGSADEAVGSR